MEAMHFTRVSMLNSTAKANVPRFTPLSFSQNVYQVCSTSFSKHSQRNHAIKVTNSGNKGDEAASYVVDTVKEANEKLKQDFTALKDGTNDMDMKKSIQDTAAFVADKAEDGKSEVAKIAEAVVDKTNEAGVGALDAAEGTTKKIKEAIVDLKQ
nr:hypothetical protein [Tanacetum cinerariifolium]